MVYRGVSSSVYTYIVSGLWGTQHHGSIYLSSNREPDLLSDQVVHEAAQERGHRVLSEVDLNASPSGGVRPLVGPRAQLGDVQVLVDQVCFVGLVRGVASDEEIVLRREGQDVARGHCAWHARAQDDRARAELAISSAPRFVVEKTHADKLRR